jgi:hypothetical protein
MNAWGSKHLTGFSPAGLGKTVDFPERIFLSSRLVLVSTTEGRSLERQNGMTAKGLCQLERGGLIGQGTPSGSGLLK